MEDDLYAMPKDVDSQVSTANPDESHALSILERLARELALTSDERATHERVLSAARELCAAQRATLHLRRELDGPLALVRQVGFEEVDANKLELDLGRAESTAYVAACEQRVVSVGDFANEPQVAEASVASKYGYRSAHSVPLEETEGQALRVLTLYFHQKTELTQLQSKWLRTFLLQLALVARRKTDEVLGSDGEDRFRSIFQESSDFILTADLHQRITYCNPALAHAGGWSQEAIVGRFISEFIPAPHFNRTSAMLDQKLREGGSTRYEVEVIARDGRRMTWEINSRLTFGPDGKPTGLHAIGRDVTSMRAAHEELRRSERRLREADQRKNEFLAMLAHELRNPLAPIRAAAHVFKQPTAKPEQLRQASAIVERQVEHIARIVDDLLDVSRLIRGLVTFEMRPTDLREVINTAVEQVRPLIESKQHSIEVQVPDEPMIVSGEYVRLVQMLANLLNNAARHSGRNARIELSVITSPQIVELHVRDNGAGIDPELLPNIFDLFTQADRSAARSEGGLGIGLPLVRRIAELHGGHLEAHSEGLNRGADFSVVLPRLAPESVAATESPAATKPTDRQLRILVTDDNQDAANMLSVLLELEGHQTSVTYDGTSALARANAEQFDVMLLDIGLPDMSGYELAERLRATLSSPQPMLVAITGYGQAADRVRAQQAGFDHHLTKPVSTDVLRELLTRTR